MVDSNEGIFIYFGPQADPQTILSITGVEDLGTLSQARQLNQQNLPARLVSLPRIPTHMNNTIHIHITGIRYNRGYHVPVYVLDGQCTHLTEDFKALFVEDKMGAGGRSYIDVLCLTHMEVRKSSGLG